MKRCGMLAAIAAVYLVSALAFGGCSGKEKTGIVKTYGDADTITLSMFSPMALSDNFWASHYALPDGTKVNIVEYSSRYYTEHKLSYRDLIAARLESNVDIDIYAIHVEDVAAFSRLGYWADLSATKAASNLSPEALKQSTYNGKVFSIPISFTGFGFFWNVDMLKKHGLTVPSNLPEFLYVCETLKRAGIVPYIANMSYGLTVPAMAVGFAELYASDDAERLLEELSSGRTAVGTYMEKGFRFIEAMIEKGYFDPNAALSANPGEADKAKFLAGEGAFMCGNMEMFPKHAEFETVMSGIPLLEGGSVAVFGPNYRYAVNPNSPNAKYALAMLDQIITPEWLAAAGVRTGALSSGRGECDMSYLDKNVRGFAKLTQSQGQIPNKDFFLTFSTWASVRDLCREMCAGLSSSEAVEKYNKIQKDQISALDNPPTREGEGI